MANLRELVEAFNVAKGAWDALCEADPDGEDDNPPEWEAYEAAEHAVIVHPCQTIEDVHLKARFFLINAGPNDTLRNCLTGDQDWTLDCFLRSLLGEGASCG